MTGRVPAVLSLLLLTRTAMPVAAQEEVTLTFAWSPGTAEVTMITESSALMGGQPMGFENEVRFRMTVTEAPNGLRVTMDDYMVDGEALDELLESADVERMSELLAYTRPDWLVSDAGEFQGVSNFQEIQAAVREMLDDMMAELDAQGPGMGEVMRSMMEETLTEEAMSESAKLEWDRMVGWWAGRTLREGEPVTVTTQMKAPMMGNQNFQVATELVFVGRVACEEGGPDDGCLELVSRGSPDAEELRNAMDIFMADMMEQAGGTGMEMGITELMMDQESRLVVEPGTLRPIRMESAVDLTMGMEMMGTTQRMENNQLQLIFYEWSN